MLRNNPLNPSLVGGAPPPPSGAANIAMRRRESDTMDRSDNNNIDNSALSWKSRGMSVMSDVSVAGSSCTGGMDDSSKSHSSSRTHKQMNKSRMVIEKRGRLPNYSVSVLEPEETTAEATLSPRSPGRGGKGLRGGDKRQHQQSQHFLSMELDDFEDSIQSISFQDLNMPFTQLQGLTIKTGEDGEAAITWEDDANEEEEEDNEPISPLPRSSPLRSKKQQAFLMANDLGGRSKSLHTSTSCMSSMVMSSSSSGNNHPAGLHMSRHRSQSLQCLSSYNNAPAHAPMSPVLNTRRRQSIVKPLIRALSMNTFDTPATTADKKDKEHQQQQESDVKFTLKRRNMDESDRSNAGGGGRGGRRLSSSILSSGGSDHTSAGDSSIRRSSSHQSSIGSVAFSIALKESRRDQLNDILSNPRIRQQLDRSSLRNSYHQVSAVGANQKHLQSTIEENRDHRDSICAKKEAKLMEAFNEGMTDFSSRTNASRSPKRSSVAVGAKMRGKSMSILASGLMLPFAGGGDISPASSTTGGNTPPKTAGATSTTTAGMTPTKAYIVEYMKELRQEAAAPSTHKKRRPRRRTTTTSGTLIKPKTLRRAVSAPEQDTDRSMIALVAPKKQPPAVIAEETESACTLHSSLVSDGDTSTVGAAEIQALAALAGPSATGRALLRRATTIGTHLNHHHHHHHRNSGSTASATNSFAIPKSITVKRSSQTSGSFSSCNNNKSESSLPSLQSMASLPKNSKSNKNHNKMKHKQNNHKNKSTTNRNRRNNSSKLRMMLLGDMDDSLTSATSAIDDLTSGAPSLLGVTSTAA